MGDGIKLNIVDDNEKLLNKGDALIYVDKQEINGKMQEVKRLIIVCPGCGRASASAGKHIYNEETQSYNPSIVHDKNLGGCGWHGWLKNGVYKEC